jgi:hypothetical protein
MKSIIFWDMTCHLLASWFLLNLFLRTCRRRRYVPPKRRLKLDGLHGVISQKMILKIKLSQKRSTYLIDNRCSMFLRCYTSNMDSARLFNRYTFCVFWNSIFKPAASKFNKLLLWNPCNTLQSRDSSVAIVTSYGLNGRVRFQARERDFSLLHSVQTGLRPT